MAQQKTALHEDLSLLHLVNKDVVDELARQRDKWGVQRYENPADWLVILIEEVGESAQAIQQGRIAHKDTDADDLYTEVIQVAAVAMSWAAQLLEEKQKEKLGERHEKR